GNAAAYYAYQHFSTPHCGCGMSQADWTSNRHHILTTQRNPLDVLREGERQSLQQQYAQARLAASTRPTITADPKIRALQVFTRAFAAAGQMCTVYAQDRNAKAFNSCVFTQIAKWAWDDGGSIGKYYGPGGGCYQGLASRDHEVVEEAVKDGRANGPGCSPA